MITTPFHTPADAELSVYGEWGDCTAQCGGGTQTRYKTCQDCLGDTEETQTCNKHSCPGEKQFFWVIETYIKVNGHPLQRYFPGNQSGEFYLSNRDPAIEIYLKRILIYFSMQSGR